MDGETRGWGYLRVSSIVACAICFGKEIVDPVVDENRLRFETRSVPSVANQSCYVE